MMAGTGVSVGGAGMLRTRRRDVSVKPNRKLDRKSSRGMIYENEELRLRTIHINAEVEQGQNDIKKLRRENEQLRREIWSLRDEYDKLEEILKRQKSRGESEEYEDRSEEDDGLPTDYSCEEDDGLEEDAVADDDHSKEEQLENAENQKISSEKMTNSLRRLHVDFDDLSVVDEEEELKKDRDKKEATSEDAQRKEDTRSPPPILRPRQLHENIPFYPATYEPSNSFNSSSYYGAECPFEFPSTVDLMLPADTTALWGSPCSRLHADPLIPVASLDLPSVQEVGDQMSPTRIHAPPAGWQSNLVLPQKQIPAYPTASVTSGASPGIRLYATDRARQETQPDQQRLALAGLPGQRRNVGQKELANFFDLKHTDLQKRVREERLHENGWCFGVDRAATLDHRELKRRENKNADGIFTFSGSERPKHFFAPLPSKVKKQVEAESPTTSHFGTGNSSSSGRASTVVAKGAFTAQKGSADVYVNGAIPCGDAVRRSKDDQKTFLSTDNLLITEPKLNASQLTKSMSCQDLTSEQLKVTRADGKQLAQSDNTLDSLSSEAKPYKTHLNVTLKMARESKPASPDTPEIPKLPSIDYRLFNNPFLRNFDQTGGNYVDQTGPVTRPLSVQVNEDNTVSYRYPTPPEATGFGRGLHPIDRYKSAEPNRLLIPSNQLINGKLFSPGSKHEIQVTSFERPSPHTLIPAPTPYDLNALRRFNASNQYIQNRSLYQNVPFVPRGPLYQQRGPIRMYYENQAVKVPAQTQTSIDGDSHHEDDKPRQEDGISVPNTPSGRRKRIAKKDKPGTTTGEDQKPLSPAAQRRLKKQCSATELPPESPGKLARKRPRRLSVTTTTTSEGQEDKNESRSSSSGQDSPRKDQTRRVSLYFNTKKRPSVASVKTVRSGSLEGTKDKYSDGVTNSERERTNSISSREIGTAKARKASTSSGNVPWCACWGNGCI